MMNFIKEIKSIDINILKVMKRGFRLSLITAIVGTYILLLYTYNPISQIFFKIGILVVKLAVTMFSAFFCCGFVLDQVKKGR